MTAQPLPALTSGDPSAWGQALYAFLVEKGNRSGSKRTVESYSHMHRLVPIVISRAAYQRRETWGSLERQIAFGHLEDPPRLHILDRVDTRYGIVRGGSVRERLASFPPIGDRRLVGDSDPSGQLDHGNLPGLQRLGAAVH
jgi:hypothetical protein